MKKQIKRISNRKYPPKKCAKSDCQLEFIPTDARQQYCCYQHRIDHNNDKRKILVAQDANLFKALKHNYNVLNKIINAPFYKKYSQVNLSVLEYENFDLKSFHKKEKLNNGNEVLIIYDLGLICLNTHAGYFKITKFKIYDYNLPNNESSRNIPDYSNE